MLTSVYIGSVGPFKNVYINKKKKNVNFSLFHFSTFEFWHISIGNLFQVIQSRADKLSTINVNTHLMQIYLTSATYYSLSAKIRKS